MAGILFHATSGEVAASTAPKTFLQIKAATNQRALVRGIRIFGKQPAGGLDTPVKIRLTRSTSNFGTAGVAAVAAKNNPSASETLQTTCGANFGTEPTSPSDTGILYEVQPQSGVIEFLPFDEPWPIPGGNALNFEVTAASGTPTLAITAICEE